MNAAVPGVAPALPPAAAVLLSINLRASEICIVLLLFTLLISVGLQIEAAIDQMLHSHCHLLLKLCKCFTADSVCERLTFSKLTAAL